jgi:membrane protease YdiL (CAAX protease family)
MTMSNTAATRYDNKALITFFTLVIVLSLAAEAYIVMGGPDWMYLVLMWIPAFSAIIASSVSLKDDKEKFSLKSFLSGLGIRKCRIRYILLAVLIPLIYLLIPYMIYWKTHPDNFGYTGVALPIVLKDCLPMMVVGIFPNIISAMGEEIGWRGYMLPALTKRNNHIKVLVATGLFWACWHLPLLAFGDYMAGAPAWYKLPAFVLCILPVGIIIGGLTYMSNSVWPAAFLHAAHNNFDQAVFGVITRGDDMMYYVSETGFLTIICAWVIAIIMIVKIKDTAAKKEKQV